MDADSVIQFSALVILLVLSGVFSSAETALTTVNSLKLIEKARGGNKRAEKALKLLENPNRMLSTILICNNVVNLSASALTTTLTIRIWGNTFVAVATGILTLLLLIFGEISPKMIATINNEKLSLIYGGFILVLSRILTPLVYVVDKITNLVLKISHVDPESARSMMTDFEFQSMLDESLRDGVLENEEKEMISNVVELGDSLAKDIMIPRVDMTCVNVEASYEELREVFLKERFTRYPVYEENADNIVGIINMKDVLFCENSCDFSIRDLMREANFTFEFKNTSDLMAEMRQNSVSMTIVLDEYGAAVGLVTLEDLLEEIVGEIRDEYDEYEKELIQEIGPNEYVVEGSMKLDDINDALNTDLISDDYDSIGGLVIEQLDDLPTEGESVTLDDGTMITVTEMDKNRIEKIHLVLPPDKEDEEEDIEEENADESAADVPHAYPATDGDGADGLHE